MSDFPRLGVLAGVFLIPAGFCLCGCTVGQRNTADAVAVTASPSLEERNVKFVLELRNGREEFAMNEVDAFLASDRSAKLNFIVRTQIRERSRLVHSTVVQARQELSSGLAVVRLDPKRAYGDGNLVIYITGKSDVHVLFSCAEIGRLLESHEVADDLATIRYTHPAFDARDLLALRDRIATLGLHVDNVSFSDGELEQMKAAAAARIIERYLREGGVELPGDQPLLTSGTFAATRSPKLTKALNAPPTLEQILRSNNPDVLRALIYLVRREVVELERP